MSVDLSDFNDLLEAYILTKNSPDKGDKQDQLDDIKMEIYDSYLNENFEMNSNGNPKNSKVMKEFFSEVHKFEEQYMKSSQIDIHDIAKESNRLAFSCAIRFTQSFKRYDLLKEELRNVLQSEQAQGLKKKNKRLTKKGKAWVKAAAKDMKKRTKKAKSSKKAKSKKIKKISLKKSKKNLISKKKYNELIKKRQHHKKMTLKERKQLDHALLINYCSCIKKLKNKKTKKNLEYPICMSSVYNKRKFKSPKNARSKCKKYK